KDPLMPGVFVKARKPVSFTETNLAAHELFSIITLRLCKDISDFDILIFKVKTAVSRLLSRILPTGVRVMKRLVRGALEHTSSGSRLLMKREYGVSGPRGHPDAPWICAVLKSAEEVQESFEQVQRLGLPPVANLPKNWDSLAALDLILRTTDTRSRIFD